MIKAAKVEYNTRIRQLKNQDRSGWYRGIRILTGCHKQSNMIINSPPDIDSTDHCALANLVNDQFINVVSDLPELDTSNLPSYLHAPTQCPTMYP